MKKDEILNTLLGLKHEGVSENGKLTDISLEKSSCEAKSTGILGGFRAFLTKQMPLAVEIDKDLEFSESP